MATYYAMIYDGKVAGIEKLPPYGKFEPSIKWVEYDPRQKYVEVGYIYNEASNTFERVRRSLEEEKKECLQLINNLTDAKIEMMLWDYPKNERLTFNTQLHEADRYFDLVKQGQKPSFADIPFTSTLAEKRRIPVDLLMQKVKEKALMFAIGTATVSGDRQAFEDSLKGIVNHAQLDELFADVQRWGGLR